MGFPFRTRLVVAAGSTAVCAIAFVPPRAEADVNAMWRTSNGDLVCLLACAPEMICCTPKLAPLT